MKTKTSIWLTICSLILCIGVMVTGVYSALSTTLNIAGSLGFNMHDPLVTITGTINNVTQNGLATNRSVTRTIMGKELPLTTNINFEDLYFSSGNDMIFELTFINVSDMAMTATIPLPTIGTGVTVLHNTTDYTDLTSYSTNLPTNGSKTIKFALKLTDSSKLANKVEFVWENVVFEEYYAPELLTWSDKEGWYIQMGTYNEIPVKWVPIAQSKDGKNFTQFDGKTYKTSNEECKPQSGYTYNFLSYNILPVQYGTERDYYYMSWNFFDFTDGNATYCKAWYMDESTGTTKFYTDSSGNYVNADDYSVSNIRDYLNGNTAYGDGTTPNGTPDTTTKLTPINELYSLDDSLVYTTYIQPRSISDLYAGGIKASTTENTATYTNTTPPTTSKGTGSDKLWLLSHQEYYSYVATNTATHNVDLKKTSCQTLTTGVVLGTTSACGWWLRSAVTDSWGPIFACGIDDPSGDNGVQSLNSDAVHYSFECVRPAFQIQMP